MLPSALNCMHDEAAGANIGRPANNDAHAEPGTAAPSGTAAASALPSPAMPAAPSAVPAAVTPPAPPALPAVPLAALTGVVPAVPPVPPAPPTMQGLRSGAPFPIPAGDVSLSAAADGAHAGPDYNCSYIPYGAGALLGADSSGDSYVPYDAGGGYDDGGDCGAAGQCARAAAASPLAPTAASVSASRVSICGCEGCVSVFAGSPSDAWSWKGNVVVSTSSPSVVHDECISSSSAPVHVANCSAALPLHDEFLSYPSLEESYPAAPAASAPRAAAPFPLPRDDGLERPADISALAFLKRMHAALSHVSLESMVRTIEQDFPERYAFITPAVLEAYAADLEPDPWAPLEYGPVRALDPVGCSASLSGLQGGYSTPSSFALQRSVCSEGCRFGSPPDMPVTAGCLDAGHYLVGRAVSKIYETTCMAGGPCDLNEINPEIARQRIVHLAQKLEILDFSGCHSTAPPCDLDEINPATAEQSAHLAEESETLDVSDSVAITACVPLPTVSPLATVTAVTDMPAVQHPSREIRYATPSAWVKQRGVWVRQIALVDATLPCPATPATAIPKPGTRPVVFAVGLVLGAQVGGPVPSCPPTLAPHPSVGGVSESISPAAAIAAAALPYPVVCSPWLAAAPLTLSAPDEPLETWPGLRPGRGVELMSLARPFALTSPPNLTSLPNHSDLLPDPGTLSPWSAATVPLTVPRPAPPATQLPQALLLGSLEDPPPNPYTAAPTSPVRALHMPLAGSVEDNALADPGLSEVARDALGDFAKLAKGLRDKGIGGESG
jgi:hypothetical protein